MGCDAVQWGGVGGGALWRPRTLTLTLPAYLSSTRKCSHHIEQRQIVRHPRQEKGEDARADNTDPEHSLGEADRGQGGKWSVLPVLACLQTALNLSTTTHGRKVKGLPAAAWAGTCGTFATVR
jgi:hypothetical protein